MTAPVDPPTARRFELTAPAPIRALAIAAVAAVLAMGLLVVWGVTGGAAALVAGIVVLVLALALAGGALVLTRRLRTLVVLGADTITVSHGGRSRSLAWSEVEEVGLQGRHLILAVGPGQGEGVAILNPRTRFDPTFLSVVTTVRDRLNDDRGYGARPFGP